MEFEDDVELDIDTTVINAAGNIIFTIAEYNAFERLPKAKAIVESPCSDVDVNDSPAGKQIPYDMYACKHYKNPGESIFKCSTQ